MGDLLARVRAQAAQALRSGDLEPLGATLHELDGFQVRQLAGVDRKGRRDGPRVDPFLPPYPPALHVADWPPDHAILLNRYPALADHLLLVTRHDAPQEAPCSPADLEAFERLRAAFDGLGFYNGGAEAGASQPHRHLQLVGREALGVIPLEPAIVAAVQAGRGQVREFPFVHAVGAATEPWSALFAACGLDPGRPGPHSWLAAGGWRLVVPRSTGVVRGMPVNSLAYAGLLAVTSAEQLDLLRTIGPWTVLIEAGVTAA